MKTYSLKKSHFDNLQHQKKMMLMSELNWTTGADSKKIVLKERSYQVNKKVATQGGENSVAAIGFFSGAGGLDIGAHLAGVNVISSMDFDKDCVSTLSANKVFSPSQIVHGDIRGSKGSDYRQVIKEARPKKLILIGGPPCQPFSKAGYWVTHQRRMGSEDPRNMIGQYLRMIDELDPDGFLLENVESLLHPKNRDAVESLEESINSLGYHFIKYRADAQDFGVPQKRKRIFFIASKKPIKHQPIISHVPADQLLVHPGKEPYERVIDWIGKFDQPEYFEPYEITDDKTYGYELSEIPPGENYFALTDREGYPAPKFEANKRFWNFLLKLHPLQASWTISAQPGPWVGPLHWANRRLRIPEISAIQTFPEDFVFSGSRRSIQKQIGNAVPPLLGKAMVETLLKNL